MELRVNSEFQSKVAGYRCLLFEADVANGPTLEDQWSEMQSIADQIASQYEVADINSIPTIEATRRAYRACGKDPNRYRPSQEQLMRRIVRGLGLYSVNAIVDAGNMLSLLSGCSVGCFDADKIVGAELSVGIGREGEPYEGIGRGELNVAGLPIVRDSEGGIGTPTSDNERTKIEPTTTRLVATVHLFDTNVDASEVVSLFESLFTKYASAKNITVKQYA